MASNEVGLGDVVGGLDLAVAEAEVGNGYTAGLLTVVLEVTAPATPIKETNDESL